MDELGSLPGIPVPATPTPRGRKSEEAKAKPRKYRIVIEEGGIEDQPFVFVGVNHQTYKIMRGDEVEIPAEVKEVLDNAITTYMVRDNSRRLTPRRSLRFPYRVLEEIA